MLVKCPECKHEVSDQAKSCPNCGHPITIPLEKKERKTPTFQILAFFGFLIELFIPRFLVFIPVFGVLAFSVISFSRGEKRPILTVLIMLLSIVPLIGTLSSMQGLSSTNNNNLSSVKIVDKNWSVDPDFGGKGAVIWNVQVKNVSEKYIKSVTVEFTTYDSDGHLISTDFSDVNAIPPSELRAIKAYADYYGTENEASFKITEVRFADQ